MIRVIILVSISFVAGVQVGRWFSDAWWIKKLNLPKTTKEKTENE